jgi:broad specificity phosphatase PhoE
MASLFVISHPEVTIDPLIPVERWGLSDRGIARMREFAGNPVLDDVTAVWASSEAKAIEAAGLLAARLGIGVAVERDLGENDRSATGFLPPDEFEAVADAFFAHPTRSVRGWERAVDAQIRVGKATELILARHGAGDIAIVGHGGVGTLLLCRYLGLPISRELDQPHQGHYWTVKLPDLAVQHRWRPIAPRG